jgi:hypothetical protein
MPVSLTKKILPMWKNNSAKINIVIKALSDGWLNRYRSKNY